VRGARAGRIAPSIAFAAGAAASFGFAPWDLWPLSVLGLAALLLLIEQAETRRRAAWTGWLFGLGHFLVGTHWIAQAFQYQDSMPPWLGWIGVGLLSLYLAVFPALAAAAAWHFRRSRLTLVLAFTAAWIVAEWLRGTLFSGFPWNPLGAAALPMPGLAQAAAFVGALGLSGLICLLSGALVLVPTQRHRLIGIAAVGVVAAIAFTGFEAQRQATALTTARLDIVQADIGQDEKWSEGGTERAVEKYLALSPPPSVSPRLLIWPEAAVPDLLDEMPGLRSQLAAQLGPNDLMLLGALKAIRQPDGRAIAARNSLFVLDPQGRILARYDKKHLVPFGEFLPARPLLEAIGLDRLAPGALDFWPGPGARTIRLPGFPAVGPLICYEVIFSGDVVDEGDRPEWLLNVSNDAWFAGAGAHMHLAQARLRSIEEGLPMARSTPTGISAVIDPHGHVLASIPRGDARAISVRLPRPLPPTLFSRVGQLLPLLLALALAGGALVLERRWRGSI
jgi:apolipoprotein N-acyltransferase